MGEYTSISLRKRLFATILAVAFFLFALIIRLFIVQIVDGHDLQLRAVKQWMRDIPTSAIRGQIIDRNGVVLASSYTTYDIYVRPASVISSEHVASALSSELELDYQEMYDKISNKRYSEILIKTEVEKEVASLIIEKDLPGVYLSENSSRYYEYGDLLSQVLGYVDYDGNGQAGLEQYYNKYLKGVPGSTYQHTDTSGKELDIGGFYIPSIPGLSIQLTIDVEIQQIAENVMQSAYYSTSAKSTSAIVLDPSTSEILGIAIKPSMDLNNLPRENISELLALSRNSAICDTYEPGSTFKILTTAIAMQLGLTSPGDGFYCGGFRIANGVRINCHRKTGHGSQSLTKGLCNSCNCVFMELISRIGLDKFYEYMTKLGISTGIAVDFPSSAKGILMSKPSVTISDLLRMGFGQSIALSPLQLINSVACVINGGTLNKAYFLKSIKTNDNEISYIQNATKISNVFSSNVSSMVNQMLEEVVSKGGGKNCFIEGYKIAGKTGTAQKYENGAIAQGKYVASFIGYAPADNPKYLVLVIVDEPKGAFYGGSVAAPLAKQIFQQLFDKKQISPFGDIDKDLSLNQKTVEVPNLLGMTLSEASSKLSSLELNYLIEGSNGEVVYQNIGAGSMVAKNDVIIFRMSIE